MTIKSPEREMAVTAESSLADSEIVSKYLSDHPGFFDQHPELLNKLHIPHTERGSAVSLVERQVLSLRSNNKELNQQLQELVNVARENDRLADRLHRFTLTLLECRTLKATLAAITAGLVEEFGIEQVVMRFDYKKSANKRYEKLSLEIDSKGDDTSTLLEKIFKPDVAPVPVCFNHADKGFFQELFDTQSQTIGSSVVLPLGGKPATGLLALGSIDEQRFQPKMSIMYLTRLADLINGVLDTHASK
jgi:uncharacterized protein YigA (DUF484 family)